MYMFAHVETSYTVFACARVLMDAGFAVVTYKPATLAWLFYTCNCVHFIRISFGLNQPFLAWYILCRAVLCHKSMNTGGIVTMIAFWLIQVE